ncbi:histone-like nucleoid-structuring protein Lsr2 [Nocardia sp. NPDC048505]|uniref:Lsr2 dimerization domain-containing protein n=1 Tax=Nocardia sp. NPDC048505 TaxID=3155756 RepID=UPI0033F76774
MAKKVVTKTVVTDDLDGKEIQDGHAIEVKISIAGAEYRLDLRTENVEKFRTHVRKWLDAAEAGKEQSDSATDVSADRRPTAPVSRTNGRRPSKSRGSRVGAARRRPREEVQAVRDWAVENGFDVSPRGRIANDVLDAFNAAR